MTGYEGSHQDWLEDRASDQLEREAFMREYNALPTPRFPLWQFEGWHDDRLQIGIPGIGAIRLTEDQAVLFAHAILSEVECREYEAATTDPVALYGFDRTDEGGVRCKSCGQVFKTAEGSVMRGHARRCPAGPRHFPIPGVCDS